MPLKAEPDSPDVREEALDDVKALSNFQQVLRDPENPPAIIAMAGRTVQAEIDETIEEYRREWEARNE